MLTATLESNQGKYIYNLSGGSDTGMYQMLLSTYYDLYKNYLDYFPDLKALVDSYRSPTTPVEIEIAGNLNYQIVLAYVHYERLLCASGVQKWPQNHFLGVFWWKHLWNTEKGSGTGKRAFEEIDRFGVGW